MSPARIGAKSSTYRPGRLPTASSPSWMRGLARLCCTRWPRAARPRRLSYEGVGPLLTSAANELAGVGSLIFRAFWWAALTRLPRPGEGANRLAHDAPRICRGVLGIVVQAVVCGNHEESRCQLVSCHEMTEPEPTLVI